MNQIKFEKLMLNFLDESYRRSVNEVALPVTQGGPFNFPAWRSVLFLMNSVIKILLKINPIKNK